MSLDKSEFINVRMAHAHRTLEEVDILIENGLWNTGINRLYYACFYAVTALLYNNDLFSKTHSGVQTLFGMHFVKKGVISESLGKFYTEIFSMRQNADYEDEVKYEKADLVRLMQPANELIAAIENLLANT